MKRNIRRQIDIGLTGLGIAIIFSAVILGGSMEIQLQLPLALVGVLLMEAGVWGLSSKLFPNERRYSQLRDEGDENYDGVMRLMDGDMSGVLSAPLEPGSFCLFKGQLVLRGGKPMFRGEFLMAGGLA